MARVFVLVVLTLLGSQAGWAKLDPSFLKPPFFKNGNFKKWYGPLRIAPRNRCAPYNPLDYDYSSYLSRARIIEHYSGVAYGPYEGRVFTPEDDIHVEHIVARAEAHDSGMCGQSFNQKQAFSIDLLNLTLASASVNREKSNKDLSEWLPPYNRCWFVARTLEVRAKYDLSINKKEARDAYNILSKCEDKDFQIKVFEAKKSHSQTENCASLLAH